MNELIVLPFFSSLGHGYTSRLAGLEEAKDLARHKAFA